LVERIVSTKTTVERSGGRCRGCVLCGELFCAALKPSSEKRLKRTKGHCKGREGARRSRHRVALKAFLFSLEKKKETQRKEREQ